MFSRTLNPTQSLNKSCVIKIQIGIGLTYLVSAYRGYPGKNGCLYIYAGISAEAARQAAAFACLHYRKPKRIRTAFSPTQLVRLEEAFDSNQYVVGQERKDLAASLSLTETQVTFM